MKALMHSSSPNMGTGIHLDGFRDTVTTSRAPMLVSLKHKRADRKKCFSETEQNR
jgi:hypothetical protein